MAWLREHVRKVVIGALGVVLTLACWSLLGPRHRDETIVRGQLPARVWGGGDHHLTVESDTTVGCRLALSLQGPKPGQRDAQRHFSASVDLPPGRHTHTVEFPASTRFGYLDLGATAPALGDVVRWVVRLDGQVIDDDGDALEEALGDNEAMFLTLDLGDFLGGQ